MQVALIRDLKYYSARLCRYLSTFHGKTKTDAERAQAVHAIGEMTKRFPLLITARSLEDSGLSELFGQLVTTFGDGNGKGTWSKSLPIADALDSRLQQIEE